METKQVKLRLKEVSEKGRFIGLSSVYGNRDLGDDVMVAGALTKTIEENNGRFPLLYGHKVNVGVSFVEDTKEGLVTEGLLNLEKQISRDVHSDLRFYKENGLDFGMSIGYLPIGDKTEFKNGVRFLKEVKLFENTLTEIPMNPKARVQQVKDLSLLELVDLLAELKSGRFDTSSKADIGEAIKRLSALIADPEPDAARDAGEGAAVQSKEPAIDHSALSSKFNELKELYRCQ